MQDFFPHRSFGNRTTMRLAPSIKIGILLGALVQVALAQDDLLSHTQPDTSEAVSSIVLASCFDYGPTMPETFERIVSQDPDLFMAIGDNIYADTEDMDVMRAKYDAKKRSAPYRAFLEAGIPVMAHWDDHDFADDDQGKYYPKRSESQREFLRHFDIPEDDPRYYGQEGVYSSKIFAPGTDRSLHVIMLDNRYDRSPTFEEWGECEGEDSAFLSEAQWAWLEGEFRVETELKILSNGIQILPPTNLVRPREQYCSYGDGELFNRSIASLGESALSGTQYESWGEIPAERERLLRMVQRSINDGYAKNVILVSGDRHRGELLQKTVPGDPSAGDEVTLFEICGTGIGQNGGQVGLNPNRLPVWADDRGNEVYDTPCAFPFVHEGALYKGCVYDDPDLDPWCYKEVGPDGTGVEGEWGLCAPGGASIPTGRVGTVAGDIDRLTSADRHVVDLAGSNYGKIDISWGGRFIRLALHNEYEEMVSTIIPFQ